MSAESDDSRLANVNVELKVGERKLAARLTVPAGPTRLIEILPIVQRIADTIVDAGVEDAAAEGRTVSCTKGCGACCRQLVPISEVEARRIGQLVAEMPEPRQAHVRARLAEARQQLSESGMLDQLLDRASWNEETFIDIGTQYFHLGVACPFLEEESCSIHLDRPITCREYLVTSPAENCRCPTKDNIAKVDTAVQVWTTLARFDTPDPDAKYIRWVPLVIAPEWAETHPDDTTPRPGPELLRDLFQQLAGRQAPPPVRGH
jgi:Fe-S-cluster containining protein